MISYTRLFQGAPRRGKAIGACNHGLLISVRRDAVTYFGGITRRTEMEHLTGSGVDSIVSAVQDRYAGDVGDFMKLGLLRALVAGDPPFCLGVNWYLTGNESHNEDGKHTGYLRPGSTHYATLRSCDTDLMGRLAYVVATNRSVAAIEMAGVLPAGSLTYPVRLLDEMGETRRRDWHHSALESLVGADVIFVDPDNGIRTSRQGSKPSKFVFLDELADYCARAQSVVIYHHADRTAGGVAVQVARRLAELATSVGVDPLGAVIARRGSTRYFFIVPARAHRDRLASAVRSYLDQWAPHVEFVDYSLSQSPSA
jgi:hypothetical protein